MAALASSRPYVRRGPSSAVDLLSRLRGPLPDPEPVDQPRPQEPPPPVWEAPEPTGDAIVDLRMELQAARAAGVAFEVAWRVALQRVGSRLAATQRFKGEYGIFMAAAIGTKHAWADAYHRTGTRLFAVETLRAFTSE